MEFIAWAIYGIFLIAPYLIAFALFFVLATVIVKSTLKRNRHLGIAVLISLVVGIGFVAIQYILVSPLKFNSACASGIGLQVLKPISIKTNSYILQYVDRQGLLGSTDATIESAISYVASEKLEFVEIQDSKNTGRRFGVWGILNEYKQQSQEIGYFKVSRSIVSSGRCRWLMPNDVKPLDYGFYLPQPIEHNKNRALSDEHSTQKCIAVEYIQQPTSQYLIAFSIGKEVSGNLVQHEIRAIDLTNNELIGKDVAYEYETRNIYASLAFRLGSGNRHPRCPLNPFDQFVVKKLLGL